MVRDISIQNMNSKEEIEEIEGNLQRLTNDVTNISIDYLPICYQRHIAGVSGHFGRLLCRVSHVVMCYHEHED